MEKKLNNLAPELFKTVEDAQNAMAEWFVPSSKISDKEVLSKLLGILDRSSLVKKMREIDLTKINPSHIDKYWPDSPNISRTTYMQEALVLEIKFKNDSIYQYRDVPVEVWNKLIKAVSIGSFLHREIKGNFRYQRV